MAVFNFVQKIQAQALFLALLLLNHFNVNAQTINMLSNPDYTGDVNFEFSIDGGVSIGPI